MVVEEEEEGKGMGFKTNFLSTQVVIMLLYII
jgi:hypothetical protein